MVPSQFFIAMLQFCAIFQLIEAQLMAYRQNRCSLGLHHANVVVGWLITHDAVSAATTKIETKRSMEASEVVISVYHPTLTTLFKMTKMQQ